MVRSSFPLRDNCVRDPLKCATACVSAGTVLDINLNDGSGIELRQGLKAAGVSVPVILHDWE